MGEEPALTAYGSSPSPRTWATLAIVVFLAVVGGVITAQWLERRRIAEEAERKRAAEEFVDSMVTFVSVPTRDIDSTVAEYHRRGYVLVREMKEGSVALLGFQKAKYAKK